MQCRVCKNVCWGAAWSFISAGVIPSHDCFGSALPAPAQACQFRQASLRINSPSLCQLRRHRGSLYRESNEHFLTSALSGFLSLPRSLQAELPFCRQLTSVCGEARPPLWPPLPGPELTGVQKTKGSRFKERQKPQPRTSVGTAARALLPGHHLAVSRPKGYFCCRVRLHWAGNFHRVETANKETHRRGLLSPSTKDSAT